MQFVSFKAGINGNGLADKGQMSEYTTEGKMTRHMDLTEPNKLWQHVSEKQS
jgi:hypothetical protein